MDSGVLLCLVCVLSVVEVPAIRADFCSSYSDYSGDYHDTKQCGLMYCCGDCSDRYCCSDKSKELSYSQQKKCPDSPTHSKMSRVPLIIGGVLGALLPAIFCVTLIICCVAPCCICYKLCRKRRRPQTTVLTNIVTIPQQPVAPSDSFPEYPREPSYPGCQPTYPGYQPVPQYGPSFPSAPPPSYTESTAQTHNSNQPMHPLQPPSLPQAPPSKSGDHGQLPYNPSYLPNQ
ncbi:protein shisa-4-like isoform X1 [Gouania willdenowi]|uniref:Protein shisa-4-like n=1 Tax=Gouania willdenowi TaxID=441366 RepID=A0A8C5DQR2_GOUWI|nr:protein shisa-4-like isoform X1 [Gouania willdenowi]